MEKKPQIETNNHTVDPVKGLESGSKQVKRGMRSNPEEVGVGQSRRDPCYIHVALPESPPRCSCQQWSP